MKIDRLHQIRGIEKPAAVRSKTRTGVPRRGYRLLGTYSRTFIAASLAKDVLPERIREWVCLVPSALTDALSASAEAGLCIRPLAANLPPRVGEKRCSAEPSSFSKALQSNATTLTT